jgi:DegV family protein with EDD domain
LAQRLGIAVVQLQLQIGDELHEEKRVAPGDLIAAMRGHTPVGTTPPHLGALYWAYQDAAVAGMEAVVSLHISARQSQTCEVAREAATESRIPVYVVDTATVGMSAGYAVLAAAEAAAQGADASQVIAAAQRRFASSTELVYVDTLEYLRRSGRIGAASALVGSALSMKPLLTIEDGQTAPLDRVLGTDRAMRRMVQLAVELAGDRPVDLAVEHFGAEKQAMRLIEKLRSRVPHYRHCILTQVSAIIGAHVGPGAVAITVAPVG